MIDVVGRLDRWLASEPRRVTFGLDRGAYLDEDGLWHVFLRRYMAQEEQVESIGLIERIKNGSR